MVDLGSDPEEMQWLLQSLLEQSAEQEPRPLLMLQWQQPEQQEPEPQQQQLAVRQPEPELVGPDPAVAPVDPEELREPLRPRLPPVADLFVEPAEAAGAGAGRQPRTLARSPAVRRSTRSLRLPTVEGLGQAKKSKGGRI